MENNCESPLLHVRTNLPPSQQSTPLFSGPFKSPLLNFVHEHFYKFTSKLFVWTIQAEGSDTYIIYLCVRFINHMMSKLIYVLHALIYDL